MFEIGQIVRVVTGWISEDESTLIKNEHYLWKDSLVKIIDIEKDWKDGTDLYAMVYAEKQCFIPGEYGVSYKQIASGVQRVFISELANIVQQPVALGKITLPKI